MSALPEAGTAVAADIEKVCQALGLAITQPQAQALARYAGLLSHWNATYNLTAVRDLASMLTQHLADCLAVVPPLQRYATAGRLLDVGSGGGLPGVVIAALLPGWDITCVDAVGKKAAFVRQVAGVLPLPNLHARHARVEALQAEPFDLIASRAFATLADTVAWTRNQLRPGGIWMSMKGKVPDDEIAALPADIDVFHVEQLLVPGLAAQRCLVWMRVRDAV